MQIEWLDSAREDLIALYGWYARERLYWRSVTKVSVPW